MVEDSKGFSFMLANIILHITLISTAIVLLFFLYSAKIIEPAVITNQIDRIINDTTKDMKIFLTDDQKKEISAAFKDLQPPDMSKEDAEVREKNDKLLKKSQRLLAVGLIIGISISLALSYVGKFSFMELLKENFLALLVVIAVEISFLTFFAKNYRTLDENMILKGLIEGFRQYSL